MTMMKEKTVEIVDLCNEFKELFVKQVAGSVMESTTFEELKAYQLMIKMFDKAMDFAVYQAEVIDEQSKKIDKLLYLVEKKGV